MCMEKVFVTGWCPWEIQLRDARWVGSFIKHYLVANIWEMERKRKWSEEDIEQQCKPPGEFQSLEWSFRAAWSWAKMARPTQLHRDQPVDVSCPGEGHDLRWKGLLPRWQSSKGLTRDSTSRSWGNMLYLKGGLAQHSGCRTTTRWLQNQCWKESICPVINIIPTLFQTLLLKFLGKSNKVLCHNNKR